MKNYLHLKNMNKKIAFFTPTLDGGVGKVITNLIENLYKEKIDIDLLVVKSDDSKLKPFNGKCKVFNFKKERAFQSFLSLGSYLKEKTPNILISFIFHANLLSILARFFFSPKTKLVISEHIALKNALKSLPFFKKIFLSFLIKNLYPHADCIVTVSEGAAKQIEELISSKYKSKITVIYNPVIDEKIFKMAQQLIDHPWFKEGRKFKIVLSIGRITAQKDFITLVRAFKFVREKINAKLVILGDGEEREKLEKEIRKLNLQNEILLPGFVENPYPYFKNSDIFVLSSRYEGLSNVLIEALAFGLPIVSTDCPAGPREVLENGKYGLLVPVGNYKKMAEAIIAILNNEIVIPKEILIKRALDFEVNRNIKKYKELFLNLL
jgi:glycosyltransferase involved in cell wall biosynthesis